MLRLDTLCAMKLHSVEILNQNPTPNRLHFQAGQITCLTNWSLWRGVMFNFIKIIKAIGFRVILETNLLTWSVEDFPD